MSFQVHDYCGLELVSQDLIGFTLDALVAHLEANGWQRAERSDEGIQYTFVDAITPVLTLTIHKDAGAYEREVK